MFNAFIWYKSLGWDLPECGWDLAECGWDLASCGWGQAERLEHLAVNAKVATVLGSFPVSSDAVESEGRQMKQCWITYMKKWKTPNKSPFLKFCWFLLVRAACPSFPLAGWLWWSLTDPTVLGKETNSKLINFYYRAILLPIWLVVEAKWGGSFCKLSRTFHIYCKEFIFFIQALERLKNLETCRN